LIPKCKYLELHVRPLRLKGFSQGLFLGDPKLLEAFGDDLTGVEITPLVGNKYSHHVEGGIKPGSDEVDKI
jgi:hypothetical protein